MTHYMDVPVIDVEPRLLVDLPSETGEGPLWDDRTETLTWNDIPSGTLYRYDPATRENTVLYRHHAMIGGHTLQEDGSLLLFCTDGLIQRWHEGGLTTIVESIPAVVGSRFNDVVADPAGRVFAGTMPLQNGPAQLYRLDTDGALHLVWDDLGLGNGMGFSPDERTFYHSDSDNACVYRADYDSATGEMTNREALIRIDGVPDGMTIDCSGDIWLAVWDGNSVLHYSAAGELLERIAMPVKKVTSLSFGGPKFGTAYITTAGGNNRGEDEGERAGSLFEAAIPGVRGKQDFRSRVGL